MIFTPETSQLPKHIAIVMDGNGRWAKNRNMPRLAGHHAGVEAVRRVVKGCAKRNIKVLSLFAFSSENWRRPPKEVNHLMRLLLTGLEKEVTALHENQISLRFIGNRENFSDKLCNKIKEVERLTANNSRMTLIIAADYGGQWDICQAVKQVTQEVMAGRLTNEDITPAKISTYLSFADLPDPDLFVRTSGELRISNFMLWQIAYTELYFTDLLWPDFDEDALDKALLHYTQRERRFGYNSQQISQLKCSNKD